MIYIFSLWTRSAWAALIYTMASVLIASLETVLCVCSSRLRKNWPHTPQDSSETAQMSSPCESRRSVHPAGIHSQVHQPLSVFHFRLSRNILLHYCYKPGEPQLQYLIRLKGWTMNLLLLYYFRWETILVLFSEITSFSKLDQTAVNA